MIYNSLILPHMNYSLLPCGANCHSIELLQKKTIVHIDGDTLSQSLTRFSKYLNLNLFHLIYFTVILMIATHVNFHDREVKSSMPYFGVFTRMFVHFHLYTTHDAVYDSLPDLNFRNHCFTTYCNVWPLYTTIFSSILKLIYCLNMRIACI